MGADVEPSSDGLDLGELRHDISISLAKLPAAGRQRESARVLPGEPDLHARLRDALVRALCREWSALEERALLPVAMHDPALRISADHPWP
jgi:hypothetical protein